MTQLLQEASQHLIIEEALPIFGVCGGVPDQIIRAQAHKPAIQEVVVQLLRRYRGPAYCGVERAKGGIEPIERLIRQFLIRRGGWLAGIRASIDT